MLYFSLNHLKTQIEAANKLNEIIDFSGVLKNDLRSIQYVVFYSPFKNKKEDIYPYWKIELMEEELRQVVFLNKNELHLVKEILNGFCQSRNNKESFIENNPQYFN